MRALSGDKKGNLKAHAPAVGWTAVGGGGGGLGKLFDRLGFAELAMKLHVRV